tara:strand:- start:252 stop:518 length:267 start_codon:yes stop_codon:yes gene_type:complete
MNYISALIILFLGSASLAYSQSNLLESVKRNPEEALALCSSFRKLNSKGISASSDQSIQAISKKRNLNKIDAEILSMYVRGLHCPDVV